MRQTHRETEREIQWLERKTQRERSRENTNKDEEKVRLREKERETHKWERIEIHSQREGDREIQTERLARME